MFEQPFEWKGRVDYADTDAMGVVHHSRYLRYFERTRVNFLKSLGFEYADLEKNGYYLPLLRSELHYHDGLAFDQEFTVQVQIVRASSLRIDLSYKIHRDGILCVQGATDHVWCRLDEQRKLKASKGPQEWRTLWPKLNDKNT